MPGETKEKAANSFTCRIYYICKMYLKVFEKYLIFFQMQMQILFILKSQMQM